MFRQQGFLLHSTFPSSYQNNSVNKLHFCYTNTAKYHILMPEVHGSLAVHHLRWCLPPFMRQCWGLLTGWPSAWLHRGD